ncbi:MAG TPA: glycosyltransferase family 39 protein [Acidisarcina sp.]|nr:glycosyltransferase family 39 protein [Acidisarcina sp.]
MRIFEIASNVGFPLNLKALQDRDTGVPARLPELSTVLEALTLFVFAAFFLFYGMVPIFGGDGIGLVGADEPRYAQIAHEMLTKLDHGHGVAGKLEACITPILYGKPWLEKPALYYWRAMFAFREFGVHDWSARIPSASFAFVLITLTYLHIRRFRPGGQLDAALITACCAGIIGFARGASTDMQLAAPFCIGMLGWYAWYETDSKFWLFDIYFFVGAATLAKGPVAPFMALMILLAFAALRREWSLLRRTIWIPGIILYLAMVLPWFIAVQHRNPNFLRIFFLEHNLERFATGRYQHDQPFWFYIPITLLALTPWAVISMAALVDAIRESVAEWKARHCKDRYVGHPRAGDAFPEFLVLWALIPIVFFSMSRAKLPGYILPALPPITILTGDYLNRIRNRGLRPSLLTAHAVVTGIMTALVLLLPWQISHSGVMPPARAILAAVATGAGSAVLILAVVARFGIRRLRIATMVPMVVMLLFLFGIGPVFGIGNFPLTKRNIHAIDDSYSARHLSRLLEQVAPSTETVAVYRVRRDVEYGVAFYRNHEVANYEGPAGVPAEEHILIVREAYAAEILPYLGGRSYTPLFTYPAQNLVVYKIAAKP